MFFSDLKGNPYKLINVIFGGIILAVFLYSAIFSPVKANHPIPSESKIFWNQESQSTGLSRSFSYIVRLNFTEARNYNQYGIQLFSFFLIQLFMRSFFFLGNSKWEDLGSKKIIFIDAIVSVSLFAFFFMPFLKELM